MKGEIEEETRDLAAEFWGVVVMYLILLFCNLFMLMASTIVMNQNGELSTTDHAILMYFAVVVLTHDCGLLLLALGFLYVGKHCIKVVSEEEEKGVYSLLVYLWLAIFTITCTVGFYWMTHGFPSTHIFVSLL